MKTELSILASQACYYMLTAAEVKGARVRDQAKIMRALKQNCMDMQDSFRGDFKAGVFELDEERWKYLHRTLDERLEKGVPGNYVEGLDELGDAIDGVLLELREAEKQKKV